MRPPKYRDVVAGRAQGPTGPCRNPRGAGEIANGPSEGRERRVAETVLDERGFK